MRILANVAFFFEQFWIAVNNGNFAKEEKRRVLAMISQHRPIWLAFSNAVVLLRSTQKLSEPERSNLITAAECFAKEYKHRSEENIAVKMHWLVCHLPELLARYHTVGLFAEDGMGWSPSMR
jgi:hypothetical protein